MSERRSKALRGRRHDPSRRILPPNDGYRRAKLPRDYFGIWHTVKRMVAEHPGKKPVEKEIKRLQIFLRPEHPRSRYKDRKNPDRVERRNRAEAAAGARRRG